MLKNYVAKLINLKIVLLQKKRGHTIKEHILETPTNLKVFQ